MPHRAHKQLAFVTMFSARTMLLSESTSAAEKPHEVVEVADDDSRQKY